MKCFTLRLRSALKLALYSLPILLAGGLRAQSDLGNWLMATSRIRLSEDWSIHAEAQYRNYEILPSAEQLLLRAGINYHLSNPITLTAGYAHISNYEPEDYKRISAEHRLWQQLLLRQQVDRVQIEHRYRLEQRWLGAGDPDYLNRFRYLLRVSVPLGKGGLKAKSFFLTAYDEIFIHFSQTPFDRNRLYGALGYQFSKEGNVQLGYLAQSLSTHTRSFLQMGLFYNLDLRRQASAE